MELELTHVADLEVMVGQPIEVGETSFGFRRVIPITGGTVRGAQLNGMVLSGGSDFQLLRTDGVAELHAQYVIECDGARIYVENQGLRHGPAEAMERLRLGLPVAPELIYFRSTPRFETSDPRYEWLARHIFVGSGVRLPDRVRLSIFQVM